MQNKHNFFLASQLSGRGSSRLGQNPKYRQKSFAKAPLTGPCCMAFSQMPPYGNYMRWNNSGSTNIGLFGIISRHQKCFGIILWVSFNLQRVFEKIFHEMCRGKTKLGKMWVSEYRGWPLILLMRLVVGQAASNSLPGCTGSESLGLCRPRKSFGSKLIFRVPE